MFKIDKTCIIKKTIVKEMINLSKNRQISFKTIAVLEQPLPINEFLRNYAQISGRLQNKLFFKGLIEINSRRTHSKAIVKNNDLVIVYENTEKNFLLKPENFPLDIVFEDQNVIIINKPANIAVHPSGKIQTNTLANRVAYYYEQQNIQAKVRPVNRLDYGTSGLIIFAKNPQAQSKLSSAIEEQRVKRIYQALVQNIPPQEQGCIQAPIAKKGNSYVISNDGKPALTEFKVLQTFNGNYSLLELSLKTGRTHQIRLHLAHIGCPILGDAQHGISSKYIKRPALHAAKLLFEDNFLNIPDLEISLPSDILSVIEAVMI